MPSTTTRAARLGAAALCAGFSTACDNKPTEPVDFATLTLVTETTGDTLDVDGYILDVAGESVQVSANGTQVIDRLEPGAVSVDITGVAVNCSLSGNETRSVTIGTGLNQLRIEVVCRPALLDKIVFHSDRDGDYELFVMNPDGSQQVQLTNNDDRDQFPAVSPDGTTIAFMRNSSAGSHIYTMGVDGSDATRITPVVAGVTSNAMPDWAPDGSRIAFYSSPDGSNSDIFVVNPDGSGLTQLTFTDGQDLYPKWSHDGTKLVFAHFLDGQYQLHTVNADGTGLLRLTNHSEFDLYPS